MEEERDIVVFPDEEGNDLELEVLDYIFYNGEDVETALQNAEDLCNEELTMSEFVSVEPQYQYADEAK